MVFSPLELAIVGVLIFVVAVLYSSVGHGGASGYLAVLSFFTLAPKTMSTTALMLNLLVAGTALIAYTRAGHFSWRLIWPFSVAAIPAAFLGGMVHIPTKLYVFLLASVLVFAALRLLMADRSFQAGLRIAPPSNGIALVSGGGIGLLSGIVGVGGGIFLSPILMLMKWADAKKTSAASAFFILVNSASGLMGRLVAGRFAVDILVPVIIAAFLGGLVGSSLGASRFTNPVLRRLLGVVLLIASAKLLLTA